MDDPYAALRQAIESLPPPARWRPRKNPRRYTGPRYPKTGPIIAAMLAEFVAYQDA